MKEGIDKVHMKIWMKLLFLQCWQRGNSWTLSNTRILNHGYTFYSTRDKIKLPLY